MPNGLIIKGIGGFYYVKSNEDIYECKARGIFRKEKISPLPGDNVVFSIIDEEKKIGSIDEICKRQIELIRPQVANINQIIIVVSVKSPEPDFLLLDKLLITANYKSINAVICINKIDIDEEKRHVKVYEVYSNIGYDVISLSCRTDNVYERLQDFLKDKVTVFAGQSGVGKSTILNNLMNSNIMKTGTLSSKIQRGTHTTRHAELVQLKCNGYIIDTPGFSSFEICGIEADGLGTLYPEFNVYTNRCKFTRCSHINEPNCGVKDALENELIDKERYNRYTIIYNSCLKNKLKY